MRLFFVLLMQLSIGVSFSIGQNSSFLWLKNVGGNSLAVDKSDNIYLTSQFRDKVDVDPGPDTVYVTLPETGIYLAKYDSAANFIWVKVFSGKDLEYPYL